MTDQESGKLRATLRELLPKIGKSRDLHIGEQDTKATLIEPLLESLGWNVRELADVQREFRAKPGDNPVDYALKILSRPVLFLEAKGLGEDPSERKWVAQVLGYATTAGVTWCVLTDGDEYRFYNSTAAVDAEEKLFGRVRLSEASEDDAVGALALLSRSNLDGNLLEERWAIHFVDRRVKAALNDLLRPPDSSLVGLIRRKAPKLSRKEIIASLARLGVRFDSVAIPPPGGGGRTGKQPPPTKVCPGPKRKTGEVGLVDLIQAGELKAPVRLFSQYRKHTLEATILSDGTVEFQGKPYGSPSAAGAAARATITGREMPTNGWAFWLVEVEDGKARTVGQVRDAYAKRG